MNCQIRGLTSIRKGLRKDDTPFLVSSNSIIASEIVSGRVSGEDLESLREAIFANLEGFQFCQSGGVLFLPIWRGPSFTNPGGSVNLDKLETRSVNISVNSDICETRSKIKKRL